MLVIRAAANQRACSDGKVAQALIGDNEQDAMQMHHTIVRRIVEPGAKFSGGVSGSSQGMVGEKKHPSTRCGRATANCCPQQFCLTSPEAILPLAPHRAGHGNRLDRQGNQRPLPRKSMGQQAGGSLFFVREGIHELLS